MNLTLHLIRKDLRALRWPLLLWTAACLTHLGLRLAQFARGDAAPMTPFWLRLETTARWDYTALIVLPVLIIPLLLHLDPLRGALAFWKSVPISRTRLLTAKSFTLLAFFIALPLVCEAVYFLQTGLAVVLATALADWAWRFLPGVAAVVLGCLFTRSLKVGVPGVALALAVAVWVFQWPYGRDRTAHPLLGNAAPPRPGIIAAPAGARIEIEPATVGFSRSNHTVEAAAGKPQHTEERIAVALRLHAESLPENVLVSSVRMQGATLRLPGRDVGGPLSQSGQNGFENPMQLPAQEHRDEFGINDSVRRSLAPNQWLASSEYFPVAARELPPAGALVEGRILVSLVRRRPVTTLPLNEGAQWKPGLHRLTLSEVGPPQATAANFHATLATVLADPRGDTGGLALTPNTSFALWLEHDALPYRKHLQFISSAAWRSSQPGMGLPAFRGGMMTYNNNIQNYATTDLTRSRKRTELIPSFDPIQLLRNEATPLTLARFAEEQAQMHNWHLAIYTYDDLGTVELPLKAVVARPQLAREEDDELKPPAPSLGTQLAEVTVPPNPSRADAQKILARLAEMARQHNEDSVRWHESALMFKLAALGPENIDVLLAAVAEATPRERRDDYSPRSRDDWRVNAGEPSIFWRRVLRVACDLARPTDQAVILRFHSPRVNLLRAIEPHGWEDAALPAMCAAAAEEPVPEAWQDCFARHPGPQTQAALLAQIRLRAVPENRVAAYIGKGALPGREAASALWETVIANTGDMVQLTPAFPLAVKHGVEIIPRDLLRVLRLRQEDVSRSGVTPFKTMQSAFVQSLSLRSDCPPALAEAAAWLEQNALVLQFNDATARYELPGHTTPPPDLSAWGTFTDPLGAGRARLDGGALLLTGAGFRLDYEFSWWEHATPRVTREIEGDFTVEVTVAPSFDLALAWERRDDKIFQTSGLLVDADDYRWIRWEHALWKTNDGHELREEIYRGGRGATTQMTQMTSDLWDRLKPVRLRISRHGDFFWTAWSQGGGAWVESPAFFNPGWPRKVRAGPVLINAVTHPLTARFTDFKITPDAPLPTVLATPFALHPSGEPTPSGTQLGAWGTVENPVGGGIFKMEGNTLTVAVAPKTSDHNIQYNVNAPSVLRDVEGDFTLEATVAPVTGKKWRCAGLLISAGADFYLRVGPGSNDSVFFDRVYAENGLPSGILELDAKRDLTKPIRIRLQRRGWQLTIAHRQEGGEWVEFYPLNLRAWPTKIRAGVVGMNTSDEVFTAQFSDFTLAP